MIHMSEEMRNKIDQNIRNKFHMSLEEFDALEYEEQLRLIEQYRAKHPRFKDTVKVMIGSGEDAIFVRVKRGQKVLLSDGTVIRAGDSPKAYRERLEDRLDDAIYSKPVAFVKKMKRRVKNKIQGNSRY